jgi:hypothetical protein
MFQTAEHPLPSVDEPGHFFGIGNGLAPTPFHVAIDEGEELPLEVKRRNGLAALGFENCSTGWVMGHLPHGGNRPGQPNGWFGEAVF